MRGADGRRRCSWGASSPDYERYHDEEWGRPVTDDRGLYERMVLEGFQSGLSWLTILRKREAFRAAFAGFEIDAVARFGERDVARLIADAGIVRHRGKIESVLNNACRVRELREEAGSLAAFVWRYRPDPASRPHRLNWATLRALASTPESAALSKELRRRRWSFVGPTTVYAFMQAVGIVNDHVEGCWAWGEVEAERDRFSVPRPKEEASS